MRFFFWHAVFSMCQTCLLLLCLNNTLIIQAKAYCSRMYFYQQILQHNFGTSFSIRQSALALNLLDQPVPKKNSSCLKNLYQFFILFSLQWNDWTRWRRKAVTSHSPPHPVGEHSAFIWKLQSTIWMCSKSIPGFPPMNGF